MCVANGRRQSHNNMCVTRYDKGPMILSFDVFLAERFEPDGVFYCIFCAVCKDWEVIQTGD